MPEELPLKWVGCSEGWHPRNLATVNLDEVDVDGVYLIWARGLSQETVAPTVVRIGQGDIAARLKEHRKDREITKHGELGVTWAEVSPEHQDGVESYLAWVFRPLEGERFPDVESTIFVNSPFPGCP